jgi:HEAT repeat protein
MVPPLIDALIEEDSLSTRKFILSLIMSFGNAAALEAIERLKDDRWFVKRNMLYILAQCGTGEDLRAAAPYCRHENPRVAFEAIKCLLDAGDKRGVLYLKNQLAAKSRKLVLSALSLAGTYRVRSVVPDLVGMLKKRALTGSDIEDKIPVARALGQIGDKESCAALREVLASRTFIFKSSLEKLKSEVRSMINRHSDKSPRDGHADKALSRTSQHDDEGPDHGHGVIG